MSRGGARKGAGRKALSDTLKKQPCPLKLYQWQIDAIDKLAGSRNMNIEKAIMKTYKLKAPKP